MTFPKATKTVKSETTGKDETIEVDYYQIELTDCSSGTCGTPTFEQLSQPTSGWPTTTNQRTHTTAALTGTSYRVRATGRDAKHPSGDGHTAWHLATAVGFLKQPSITVSGLPEEIKYGMAAFTLTGTSKFEGTNTDIAVAFSRGANSAGCSVTASGTVTITAATAATAPIVVTVLNASPRESAPRDRGTRAGLLPEPDMCRSGLRSGLSLICRPRWLKTPAARLPCVAPCLLLASA